ncbi:MAG: hypothetical protein KKG33_11510 [candidate division Zixibacteria bacterium]|nr:hypothetical protein [candidate division Zixibacteria bacterium]MBU1469995.1 hypothetical protein [candidate division Zixibacteria bacterium]MBU2626175.1 hypothetical protein [candidate division Zixibacteria bacterium]
MNILSPYDLPDADLIRSQESSPRSLVWAPDHVMVVIGNGSDPDTELHTDLIIRDNIPVVRRDTGGCAVILTPEMFVASFALYGSGSTDSIKYFRFFNTIVINALENLSVDGVLHEGRSDIAIDGRKIAGTAIYRNRSVIFYHAIINAGGSTQLMERYLKVPPRMPDYRMGRSHKDFVTSLAEQGYQLSIDDFRMAIGNECRVSLNEAMISSLLNN